MNRGFWLGRRVFVTGHTGFKGAWLTTWLHHLGAIVTGYSLPLDDRPSIYREVRAEELARSYFDDVRDLPALQRAMNEAMPEVVIHMAAQAIVRESYVRPVDTFSTNVMGVANVLQAIRHVPGVRSVVVVTTDKCYENQEWYWGYRENDPLGGHDPYSASKACAELVVTAFTRSFFSAHDAAQDGCGFATARAGNVVGGGDFSVDRLVPDLLAAFVERRTATIRDPDAIRPWQFVLEPLRGYLVLAERLFENAARFGGAWNFGPTHGDSRPVGWLCDSLARIWGDAASWSPEVGEHPHETRQLRLDTAKARSRLGWEPVLCLEDSLHWIVDWTRSHKDGADMRAKTIEQIRKYEKLAAVS